MPELHPVIARLAALFLADPSQDEVLIHMFAEVASEHLARLPPEQAALLERKYEAIIKAAAASSGDDLFACLELAAELDEANH